MLEMKIPKDVRRYETKFIGPLTGRQLILASVAVSAVLVVTFLINPMLPADLGRVVQVLVAAPFICAMFFKPYGMPLEKFAVIFLYSYLLSPPIRKYSNKNRYEEIKKKIEIEAAKEKKNSKRQNEKKKEKKKENDKVKEKGKGKGDKN